MAQIALLPEEVINQIAAGEVVENPASAVKELIENAIDAEARRIEITIEKGGLDRICIEDDGIGMTPADAQLCLQRYATSKIRAAEDLHTLRTMGFRGEALAAIASISQLYLKTSSNGIAVELLPDRSIQPCARNRGTTVDVRNLFYNVPARKLFQKSVSANSALVIRTTEALALAHPEIEFSLTSQGKRILHTPATNRLDRVRQLLDASTEFSHTEGDWILWGCLSPPESAQKTRPKQLFFLNQRVLVSPLIIRAVKEGYATRIQESLSVPFILFLKGPPDQFDINVHPQKKEVRFQDERRIFSLIARAIDQALGASSAPAPIEIEFKEFVLPPPIDWTPTPQLMRFAEAPPPLPMQQPTWTPPTARALSIIDSYLLLQEESDLRVVDLNAAYARILFDSLQGKDLSTEQQSLMIPIELFLSLEESLQADEWIAEWEKMGICGRRIGRQALAIDALPTRLERDSFAAFFALWKEEGRALPPTIQRFSRGRKRRYSLPEAIQLWEKVKAAPADPMGNKISVCVTAAELAKLLAR